MTADRALVALILAVICGGALALSFALAALLNRAIRLIHRLRRPR